ncbi:protein kinase domain-containing protein [Anabaena sp. FACHB-709]|uniref:non-specific serine/threonine protein kinase n=1 Tax=Anabaena cylindrica FACHB-318 TaxID=2692880 RepID=A0ABR7ZP86_ANACY|nr:MULTISPECIES: serine/threonine-protein kinase [Nostocaceae]MBD2174505.1 protein kinase [Anabaena cylindrica FACHB-318]MBD2266265.1 protein kinase [Anabaena sp. FACHB-709]MBD2286592.1 protein kinase [Anabaena cylindrica FACHB-170]MBD2275640.1 protein kinase [Nostoc sp. PCC 7120 = FACHB-418]MBD2352101.1 protein kinase [Trichormus variabilis FACHB-171]
MVYRFSGVHCINPDCQRPYPQPWGNKFCNSCGTVLQLLDRYVPLQTLGAGGFAQIYTVWDEKTQTEKVLKVLIEDSPKALELFTQEAEVLVRLRHPGVPKVEADGHFQVNLSNPKPRQLPCLVMEKINGPTLEEMLNKYPQGCPENLVLNWLTQAIKILQELHKHQIIHRDIKPSNLMLRTPSPSVPTPPGGTGWEQLVLIDFGGAKQFNTGRQRQESSSTRLFSSGYSPPEQVTGGHIGPSVDFYALGRTMIELLTGKYPPELEDPQTGVLQWRNRVTIRPELADLLDEMVQEDVRSRPTSAAIIQKRLAKINQPASGQNSFQQFLTQVANQLTLLNQSTEQVFSNLGQTLGKILRWIAKTIVQIITACFATIWAMLLTGLGASVGTIAGFILAYRTNLGDRLVEFIAGQLPELITNPESGFGAEIIVFAAAGLGTAWGLTASGCFAQRRRFLVASFMGIISYAFGWLLWQIITSTADSGEGLVGATAISVFLLALSMGFRSHHIVYAMIGSFGTAIFVAILIVLGFPTTVLQFSSRHLWSELSLPIIFFSSVGILMSFWLGISYYLIVPGLRFLGWR